MTPGRTLFISPHHDDVALSCGGTAARWAREGFEPAIVTVFASELVASMVGDFAAWKHMRWKIDDYEKLQQVRRDEDAAAAARLGCTVRWLGLPDAIYRGDRYTNDAQLYGPLHPDEFPLAAHLAEELMYLPEWCPGISVAVPLAVGSHVDHQLVFEAGRELARRGVPVWAYEDLPYAIHTPAARNARLVQVAGACDAEATSVDVSGTLEAKLSAIECYASQVPVLFRFTDDFRAAVADYAMTAGQGTRPCERFWRVRG